MCRCAHTCTQLMRRGVEWSTDEALWRLRALESGVWVGSLLSSQWNTHTHIHGHTLAKLGEVEAAELASPAVHWSVERLVDLKDQCGDRWRAERGMERRILGFCGMWQRQGEKDKRKDWREKETDGKCVKRQRWEQQEKERGESQLLGLLWVLTVWMQPAGKHLMFLCFCMRCMCTYCLDAHLYACLYPVQPMLRFWATAEREREREMPAVCLHSAAGSSRRSTNLPGFLPLQTKNIQSVICSIKNSSALRAAAAAAAGFIQTGCMCVFQKVLGWENHTQDCLCFQVVAREKKKSDTPQMQLV